ncbi:hypothetical protein F5Y19DRAFT_447636 [Xylariaceae sp. FL1651]|nr:hypothetical protein F5Y19DRAFT_447636 [Xylariaceae sp. FL1651]
MATETPEGVTARYRYCDTLHNVPKAMSSLLSSYSGIPKDEQTAHITKLRNEAYAQFPYPCMGTFRFLDLDLARHEAYKEHVLAPLCQPTAPGKPEPLFLDCGCCLGQAIRKLVVDGAPPHRLWGSDIEPRFIEVGFELFRDGDKFPRDHFLCPGNLLEEMQDLSEDKLNVLDDKVTILNIAAVFHLFDLDDQKRVANRCLRLLRKDTGAPVLILGAQVGSHEAARVLRSARVSGVQRYRHQHNEESWEAFWRELCGQAPWKDKIAALDVKSKLFGHMRNEDPNADELITLHEPEPTNRGRLWHAFEIWVTFKSDP